jgi:hypothetical protein
MRFFRVCALTAACATPSLPAAVALPTDAAIEAARQVCRLNGLQGFVHGFHRGQGVAGDDPATEAHEHQDDGNEQGTGDCHRA